MFHYSQITRKEKPEVQNFYILHEGLVGVIDENLQEQKYDDIKEKNQKYQGNKGWVGITDKYWLTAIVPEKNKSFNAEFIYEDSYKANFILTNPTTINPGANASSSTQFFVGQKKLLLLMDTQKQLELINLI